MTNDKGAEHEKVLKEAEARSLELTKKRALVGLTKDEAKELSACYDLLSNDDQARALIAKLK